MLDNGFGVRGLVFTPLTASTDRAQAVVIQPDGKIVAGGASKQEVGYMNGYNFALVRYNPDGASDNSFGSGGKVVTTFGSVPNNQYNYISSTIYGLVLQPDGRIIAAGQSGNNITLVRYNSDGSLDTSFGVTGKVITTIEGYTGSSAYAVAIQPNGKIVVTGSVSKTGATHIALIRYNADGSLDSTFGANGIVVTVVGPEGNNASALTIQADGKIVAAGSTSQSFPVGNNTVTISKFALVRYNPDGTLDSSFGTGGVVTTAFENRSGVINSIAVQPDGKIVAAGLSGTPSQSGIVYNPPPSNYYSALARYNTDGSLDASFGANGKVLDVAPSSSSVQAVAIQLDGKIVTAGRKGNAEVVRYKPNGTLDESFGTAGRQISNVWSSINYAVAIQADGKIITAGERPTLPLFNIENSDFLVARYTNGSGRSIAKYDFDGDGKSDVSLFRPSDGVWYLNQSSAGFSAAQFGAATDKPVPADFDGDGKTDMAVYRSGTWYLLRSQAGLSAVQFGDANDIPMPADFDGDGRADLAVYRPSNSYWYFLNLVNNEFTTQQLGEAGDQPVAFDYSGDGKSDFGVYKNGIWNLMVSDSVRGNRYLLKIEFGAAGDIPLPIEYGSGIAVFRPSNATWYFRANTAYNQLQFGLGTDMPVPADYDGDGKTDVAVFRNGTWYINRTTSGFFGVQFGASGDKPAPNAFIR